jgi:hypothetical protein
VCVCVCARPTNDRGRAHRALPLTSQKPGGRGQQTSPVATVAVIERGSCACGSRAGARRNPACCLLSGFVCVCLTDPDTACVHFCLCVLMVMLAFPCSFVCFSTECELLLF